VKHLKTLVNPQKYVQAKERREYNKALVFEDFIYGQRSDENAAKLKMGDYTGDYNGCGWVALYNALRLLNAPVHPADIVYWLETNNGTRGFIKEAIFGVKCRAVRGYLEYLGCNVNMTTANILDTQIRDSRVSIVYYRWADMKKRKFGEHYAAVNWNIQSNKYEVYNNNSKDTKVIRWDSFSEGFYDSNELRRVIRLFTVA
jgi:hypothetical protein